MHCKNMKRNGQKCAVLYLKLYLHSNFVIFKFDKNEKDFLFYA